MRPRTDSFVPPRSELERAFARATAADLVFFCRQCLERGAFDHVAALAAALPERFRAEPALELAWAVARFVGGEHGAARATAERLARARSEDLNALAVWAEMEARSGQATSAAAHFAELVGRYPDYPGAQAALAALLMPGPHYRDVLRSLHAALGPRHYLEIGVASGATLALATNARVAVGVDPVDAPLEHAPPSSARVLRKTSDAFFAEHTREELFGGAPVDLVFIDGLHLFEQALRDFMHAEAWCAPESTIVLHDCVPITAATAERERRTRFWVGDTWKAAWALARYRPDLSLRTVLTPPSGLVIVRKLAPASRTLADGFAGIVQEFMPLTYPIAPGAWPEQLHVVPNSAAGLREALA